MTHFSPRAWWMSFSEWRLGAVLANEGGTPALIVWVVFFGFRIGWDYDA